jgi:hypothetical protein
VLRKICGPKRDKVTGECQRQHNEGFNDLYSSPNIIRVIKSRMGWTGYVTRKGERRGAYNVWWGNLREIDSLEDPSVYGRIIFKMDLQEVGWGMDWIELAQDRDRWRALVSAVMNLRVL